MYKIKFQGKVYNNKRFPTYEEGRKYVRRLVTRLLGTYFDDYTWVGFSVTK